MESKFYPKLTNTEAAGVLTSASACDKFSLSTQALARKLGRLDDDAVEAIIAVKNEVTATTAHSDLAEIVRFCRRECDSAMDYFASVMDLYRPADGVITRAQADANYLSELQTRNLEIYLKVDALKVKFKTFLTSLVRDNRKLQDDFVIYSTKCKNETDLKMRIETKGISSHEALRPRDKGDLSLSVVELERWVVESTNWATGSHFEYETLPVQLHYLETIITDQMRNIISLEGKTFTECITTVKATHAKMNSKFTRRVNFLETKKTSSTDWLEYSTMLYNNGKLADVNSMTYDEFIVIKLTSEMPLELRQKIFTLELGVDSMTWPLFIQALTNLVAIEKVTKVKRLAPVGNISVKSGGKKGFPQANSIPELVHKMGCLRCLKAHTVSDCPVPKTVICTHCSKPGHQKAACFSKIRSELPPGHSALVVAAKIPALPAPTGQEVVAGGSGTSGNSELTSPLPAIAPVPDMGNLRLVDVTSMSDAQRDALVGPVLRPSTPHPNSGK